MKDRIKKIITDKKISNSEFSEQTGIPKSGLSHILSGRNKPSLDYVQKILKTYPEINTNWLLFGEKNTEEKSDFSHKNIQTNLLKNELSNQIIEGKNIESKKVDKIIITYKDGSFDIYK